MKRFLFAFLLLFPLDAYAGDNLTAPVGILTTAPQAPLQIGRGTASPRSSNPQLLMNEQVNSANGYSGSQHGIAFNWDLDLAGTGTGIGINFLDFWSEIGAGTSTPYDHVMPIQCRDWYMSSGTIQNFGCTYSQPQVRYGHANEVNHFTVADVARYNGGTVGSQKGFRCTTLSGGTDSNWCLYGEAPVYAEGTSVFKRIGGGEVARFATKSSTSAERWIMLGAQDLDNEGFKLWYNGSSGNSGFTALWHSSKVVLTPGSDWASGGVQFVGYGAGTLVTDASGNITVSSDPRLKNNIKPYIGNVFGLDTIKYHWKPVLDRTGKVQNDVLNEYIGFNCHEVERELPGSTGKDKNGFCTLQDRAILAAAVNSINTLYQQMMLLAFLSLSMALALVALYLRKN